MRTALSLPWLEIRRDRAVRRSTLGAGRKRLPKEHQAEILSLYREGRNRVGLYGAARHAATATRAGVDGGRTIAAVCLQASAGMQLSAGDGGRYRFEPCVVAARIRAQQRPVVQRLEGQRLQRAGPHAVVRG